MDVSVFWYLLGGKPIPWGIKNSCPCFAPWVFTGLRRGCRKFKVCQSFLPIPQTSPIYLQRLVPVPLKRKGATWSSPGTFVYSYQKKSKRRKGYLKFKQIKNNGNFERLLHKRSSRGANLRVEATRPRCVARSRGSARVCVCGSCVALSISGRHCQN